MTSKMTMAVIFSMVLAIAAPLFSALKISRDFSEYPSIRVDIEPYDPRDLLYGHYLRFRIDWNFQDDDAKSGAKADQCLCIGEGEINPPVSLSECPPADEELTSCNHTLRGRSWGGGNFDNGVDRYYVDETLAKPLEELFLRGKAKFSLDLHITPEGKSMPGALYVDGIPLQEYIARHGGILPQPE